MQALIRQGGRHWTLQPQFLASVGGKSQYMPVWTEEATHFAGWRPYAPKRWPIASDKLAFKRYAHSERLRVPEFSVSAEPEMKDVVVKCAASSFGEQVRGPFRSSGESALSVAQGEYYERFVEGKLLKIWYWDEQPLCMEVDEMPVVTGNGIATLREQIEERAHLMQRPSQAAMDRLLERSRLLLAFNGVELDTVLPAGEQQLIEFRYGSLLMHPRGRRVIDLRSDGDSARADLVAIGRILHRGIPEAMREGTAFTVDAIKDKAGQIWLLEMNSNPTIHPMVYPAMLRDLLTRKPPQMELPSAALATVS
jgi:hypothetical protein